MPNTDSGKRTGQPNRKWLAAKWQQAMGIGMTPAQAMAWTLTHAQEKYESVELGQFAGSNEAGS
ncbi:MAG: hypothetical protein Kilf2KO_49120 [Rhodospirillales bacterium]